ncbi:hypothetical protein AYO47_03745 [Planctomyces sp. SCGC AG-212-M04]|nr:hypothetical protein AYO47_03745 [Planctomyces sp. SCGC AG-212-M04]
MRSSFRETLLAALVLAGCSLAVALIVPPTDELPHCDDWDYVETARHFLATGKIVLSDWPAFTLVTHVLWGSLFAAVLGPSYFAFRVSMFVMSWLGAIGIYHWVRDCGRGWRVSVWVAAVVLLNPLNLVYQNSFMSEVTGGTAFIWLALVLRRATSGLKPVRTGLLAAFAYLARQTAVVPLIAACLIEGREFLVTRRLDWRLLVAVGIFLPFVMGHWWWLELHGRPYSMQLTAKFAWPGMAELAQRISILLLGASLWVAPVTIGRWSLSDLSIRRRAVVIWGVIVAAVVVANGELPAPYSRQEVFDLGSGFSDSIVEIQHLEGPAVEVCGRRVPVIRVVTTVLALASLLAAIQCLVAARVERLWESRGFQLASISTVILVGLLCAVPTMYGRYVWPVTISAMMAWLCAVAAPDVKRFPTGALVLTVVYAVGGVLGLQDNSVCQQTVWRGIAQLESQGVDPREINAGLEYGGVRRFSPRYRGEQNRGPYLATLVPGKREAEFVTYNPHNIFAPVRHYAVTYGPVKDYEVIDELEFRSWWRRGRIYVLKRKDRA